MVGVDELPDRRLEFADAAVRATTELFVRQFGEPAFDEVEPRAIRRRKVDVEPLPLREPVADERRLVRAVVVHDEVHIHLRRHLRVDRIEKLPELG